MRNGIDIIIPVYNAYDDLRKCLSSVERHTNLELDRLILVNDGSPDERILPLLKSHERQNVIVIDNEENLGFSGSVNEGMSFSKERDVILLNSDTVVTARWVDNIYRCAYSGAEIATVTPLSNSATLCSVPVMCRDNALPEGLSADDMADIVEHCSIRAYPRISVAVGFCMFIKREVINACGLFDAKTFEKGYGEENDFCNRAQQLGYVHVMCDNAFVYHKGTVSFKGEEKAALCQAHEALLNDWYPMQMRYNHLYCVHNPEQYIRDNIEPFVDLRNGKKNILYLVHLDFRSDSYGNVGGTQFHVRDLCEKNKNTANIFVMARDMDYLRLTIYAGQKRHSYKFYVGSPSLYFQFRDKKMSEIFACVLDAFKIELVHIHHVDSLSLDMYYCASERGVPVVQTVHDFYAVSPEYKLLDSENKWIGGDCQDFGRWNDSVRKVGYRDVVNIVPYWRRQFLGALELCNKIIFPSESAQETFLSYFPSLAGRSEVIYHGKSMARKRPLVVRISKNEITVSSALKVCIDSVQAADVVGYARGWGFIEGMSSESVEIYIEEHRDEHFSYLTRLTPNIREDVAVAFNNAAYRQSGFSARVFPPPANQSQSANYRIVFRCNGEYFSSPAGEFVIHWSPAPKTRPRVAFIGGMTPEKGSRLLCDIIKSGIGGAYDWYLVGATNDKDLEKLSAENFHWLGFYADHELPNILSAAQIDIICIMSIWGETFCYTLSEAVLCGIPVLGMDIGAVGDRIKKFGYGWTVPYTATAADVVGKIDEIFADAAGFAAVAEKTKAHKEKTVAEMCAEYDRLYEQCLKLSAPTYRTFSSALLLESLVKEDGFVWSPARKSWFDFSAYTELKFLTKAETEENADGAKVEVAQNSEEVSAIKAHRSFVRRLGSFMKRLITPPSTY